MAHVLAISSQVASGHVGLSAIVPALNALGHQVTALPTIVLSNHPGHPECAGFRSDPDELRAMLKALESNGRLAGIDVVLTGYLPTPAHVAFAKFALETTRQHSPGARYVCDPILGDDPKGLYVAEETAVAIRDNLIPEADVIVPNRFELAWLSGQPVTTIAETLSAARSLTVPQVLATSIPCDRGGTDPALATVLVNHNSARATITPTLNKVPHGTGDLLAGLYAAEPGLGRTTARVAHVIAHSLGRPELALVDAIRTWDHVQPQIETRITDAGEAETIWIAGVDGCKAGWVAVLHPLDQPELAEIQICGHFADLLDHAHNPQFIAVDMPIGLPDLNTRNGRRADGEARKVLGGRQSSVFAIPARRAVMCDDYREACQVALENSDPPRKVSKQAFNLFPKIREIDKLITPALQDRVFEVHPEAAFWALNGYAPLDLPKKIKSRPFDDGMNERKKLLTDAGYDLAAIDKNNFRRSVVGEDDILDAFAAAWTATRIATRKARRFPQNPDVDGRGLRMEIWC